MSGHGANERTFVRLTKSQRIQHIILVISTTLLIITGFMLMSEQTAVDLFGPAGKYVFYWRGIVHRIAGVTCAAVCFYHLYYVVFHPDGRSWIRDMLPRLSDGVIAYQNVMYMLGFRPQRPKMDRFNYLEKMEYFSVYFGMFIVITTGIMLWTEQNWPKFYLDIADAFHFGEATLAALAIIIAHIFSVHYNAHVYPMNPAFLDGTISESLMKEEHALWYERILAEEAAAAAVAGKGEGGNG